MKLKSYCFLIILIIVALITSSCSNKNKSIDDLVVFLNKKDIEAERMPIGTLYSLIGATSGATVIVSLKDVNEKYNRLSFETYKFSSVEQADSWSKTGKALNSIHFGCFVMYPYGGWEKNFENNDIYQKVKTLVQKF